MASSAQQHESESEALMKISRSECGRKSLSVHLNKHRERERGKVCAECLAFSIHDLHRPLHSTGTFAQALGMLGKITLDSGKPGPFFESLENNICQFVQLSCFCFVRWAMGDWRPSFGQVQTQWSSHSKLDIDVQALFQQPTETAF